jgi:hypothetical protein
MPDDHATEAQPPSDAAARLELFRERVLADERLQGELAQQIDLVAFIELVVARAREAGIDLSRDQLIAWTRRDPLGLSRLQAANEPMAGWPGKDWLPTHANLAPPPGVDWIHMGGERLTDPFYEGSMVQARARPFNWMFHRRTRLDAFVAPADEIRAPNGFIFHLSRCGSTLAAQMLAAVPRHTVISEAPPIDEAVQLEAIGQGAFDGLLAAMVGAVGRRRFAEERQLFLKTDTWHAMALPLYRRTFPATPWVFLYRDPLEVLVSQMRTRALFTLPGALPAHVHGLEADGMLDDEYCARVMARVCEAAAGGLSLGGGLLVNYRELPQALWTRILPHFGVEVGDADRALMARAAQQNAKEPFRAFEPDSEAKRRDAKPRLLELVEKHLAEPYRKLEALREAAL